MDVKKILGNIALPKYTELIYRLDSEGDGIKIEDRDHHRFFSVRIDSETIVINSEGNLSLPIDGITIYVDSEGILKAAGLDVKAGDAIRLDDSEENGLTVKYVNVKFDSESIILDSEGQLMVPFDKELLVFDSEGEVTLHYDDKTLIFDESEGLHTRIGGWREDPVDTVFFTVNEPAPTEVITVVPTSIPEIGDQVTVEVTMDVAGLPQTETKTFTLVGNGDYLEGLDASGTLVDGVRFKKDHSEAELILDATRVASGSNLVATIHGETYVYHKVIGKYIPTDDETIFINDDLDLQVIYRVDEEKGLAIDSENRIFVKVDGDTIGFDSEGRLTGTAELEAIMPIAITSEGDSEGEGKIKLFYEEPLALTSEGHLMVKIDEHSIVLDSEGQLTSALKEGEATEIIDDSEGVPHVNVRRDEHTIFLNDSENYLELHLNEDKALEVDSEGLLSVKVDNDTVRFNSEGQLEAKTILEGEANHIYDSEGDLKIDVLYDDVTIHLNSENELELWPDEDKAFAADSEGKLFVKIDDLSVHYDSEGQLEVRPDEDKALEVTSEGKFAVKIDDKTIKFTSEGKLVAIPEPLLDGVATRVVFRTSEWDSEAIDVLYNSEAGLTVNSENELEVKILEPLHFSSEGQIELGIDDTLTITSEGVLRVDIDDNTIVLNSEGKLIVNVDNESIVYEDNIVLDSEGNPVVDSEGNEERDGDFKLKVNIDNETIRFNSEGKLSADALPKPLIPDAFLHVNSENEAEWVESKINGVSLVGDKNTEETKIFWFGTSEEYAAIAASSEGLNEYTLYIINDGAPIVPERKDYNELVNKPEINGVQLSGNKSLASFGIQPVLSSGVATNLTNNQINVNYLSGVLGVDTSNRLFADTYTTEQIDNMLASLRTVRYAATKPANPSRNTLYYVGTSSPYQIYLYDSYGTEIDLGTSAVQTYSAGQGITINTSNVISANVNTVLEEGTSSALPPTSQAVVNYAEHKTNKVTALAATSTNEQYPSAKLVYDELQNKVGAIAPDDTSLEILQGTTLRHTEPANLGPAGTVGSATSIPQITYDKFGHIQKAEGISVYPPTTAGLPGQLWVSDGVEAGTWSSLSNLMRVKYQTGSTTTSGTGSIVINGPAADAGYKRLCCVGAYVTNNIAGLSWTVTAINDAQVTFFISNITGSQTINATTVWLYVREATV